MSDIGLLGAGVIIFQRDGELCEDSQLPRAFKVRTVRLRPASQAGVQQLELVYSGELLRETLIQLMDHLRELPGVHRLTGVVATTNGSSKLAR